jgi:hypothetical protein
LSCDCDVGDRVIYHDPTPLHGVFHAVVTRRVTMPSGTLRFAVDREIHHELELCLRCTTDVSVPSTRFLHS